MRPAPKVVAGVPEHDEIGRDHLARQDCHAKACAHRSLQSGEARAGQDDPPGLARRIEGRQSAAPVDIGRWREHQWQRSVRRQHKPRACDPDEGFAPDAGPAGMRLVDRASGLERAFEEDEVVLPLREGIEEVDGEVAVHRERPRGWARAKRASTSARCTVAKSSDVPSRTTPSTSGSIRRERASSLICRICLA